MTSQYRHRRTSNPATAMPNLEPGEIGVNTANRQIAVGDAASATLGVPKPLLAIRFFDIAAIYAIGDIVTNADKIWRAIAANGPGAFNAANWELAASQVAISSNPPSGAVAGTLWWDSDNGMLYVRYNDGDSSQWVQATAMPVVDTTAFVLKTGDTMTGDLLVSKADASILLKTPNNTTQPQIQFYHGALQRWTLFTTASAPNNLSVARYNDAGAFVDSPFSLDRNDGRAYITLDPIAPFGVATKQYVDARAGDAMAYSGMQINGSMDVSQELGTTGTSADFTYAIDGWKLSKNGTMIPIAVQSASSSLFPGFSNMLAVVFSTAQASLGASDVVSMLHPIEGYRVARLAWGTANARPITIAFWSDHFKPGLYSVVARNNPPNRCYAATYTHAVSNVPQYNVITIPGDTSGTWAANNALGLMLVFCVGAGSTYVAPSANTWSAGNFHAAPGQVNGADSTSNAFRITGVVVLPGTQAPTAAQSPLLMRPYDQELVTCQRYYQKSFPYETPVGPNKGALGAIAYVIPVASAYGAAEAHYGTKMRASPVIICYNPSGNVNNKWYNLGSAADSGAPTIAHNSADRCLLVNTHVAGDLANHSLVIHYVADARL